MKTVIIYILLLAFSGSSNLGSGLEPDNMKGMVDRHNYWRAKVGVPGVAWSDELGHFAQLWADHLASKGCDMQHRPRSGEWKSDYGENIYWSQGMKSTPANVVDTWASEIEFFDQNSGQCKGGVCGHYTQLVWKNSTQIGCGMARCGDQEIWVCNYNPAGNWVGEKPY